MALNLYRRHRKDCEAKRPEDSTSGEFNERQKGWKRCACLIFVSGTLNGRFSRKRTGKTSWDDAKAFADAFEQKGSWEASVAVTPPEPTAAKRERTTLEDACSVFLTNRESARIAPATLRKYRTFTKQLTTYAASHGYVMVDQWRPRDVDLFYASMKLGPRAKGKRLGVLRAFFRFCVNRKWIEESPVSADIRPPVGASKAADKMPFTDDELARIRKACDNPPRQFNTRDRQTGQVGCEYRNDQGAGQWTGEDLKDLIELMVHTGFRISDATLFDMSRLQGNKVMIRAQKNGNHVFVWIPDPVRDRLRRRAKKHGQRPFVVGRSERLETVTNVWRRRLQHAFDAAGEFDQPATPHRFRHTFARILLEKGVSASDVGDLMGDDEKTVRQHYAAWIGSRQDRLTSILQGAFSSRRK